MLLPNLFIIQELRNSTLSLTNGPLRLTCHGADVPVGGGGKVARDGIKTNHKQMLPFICWPHTVIEGLYITLKRDIPYILSPVHFLYQWLWAGPLPSALFLHPIIFLQ